MDTAPDLTAAARRYRKAETALDTARVELQQAALAALDTGTKQAEVSRITGWTREHLRQLKKKADEAVPTADHIEAPATANPDRSRVE